MVSVQRMYEVYIMNKSYTPMDIWINVVVLV